MWQAETSRVSQRQEMRLRRLAGVDHEGPCVVCLKFELHPDENQTKQLKDLEQGNGLISSAFLENVFWQQREE